MSSQISAHRLKGIFAYPQIPAGSRSLISPSRTPTRRGSPQSRQGASISAWGRRLPHSVAAAKSQGSEFGAVIVPVLTQHFKMLFRNLIYTGLTRAKKLAVFVGTRKALAMAVKNQDTSQRQTFLDELLRSHFPRM